MKREMMLVLLILLTGLISADISFEILDIQIFNSSSLSNNSANTTIGTMIIRILNSSNGNVSGEHFEKFNITIEKKSFFSEITGFVVEDLGDVGTIGVSSFILLGIGVAIFFLIKKFPKF